jgi:hypothetical protein
MKIIRNPLITVKLKDGKLVNEKTAMSDGVSGSLQEGD